jgi:hypothetical protein
MNLKLIFFVSLFAIGFAMSATAGSIDDTDLDMIPDVFDNCSAAPNGAAPGGVCSNQIDSDGDGFGDACDADLDNDNVVAGSDFGILVGVFGTGDAVADLDCDGVVAGSDFGILVGVFGSAPGPGATAE